LWSDMRSALFHRAPWHLALWYCLFVGGCLTVIRRRRSPVAARMAWLALGIAILAMGEFVASNLADCLDMARHLFLFHACTDLTVCFAVAWSVQRVSFRKRDQGESRNRRPLQTATPHVEAAARSTQALG